MKISVKRFASDFVSPRNHILWPCDKSYSANTPCSQQHRYRRNITVSKHDLSPLAWNATNSAHQGTERPVQKEKRLRLHSNRTKRGVCTLHVASHKHPPNACQVEHHGRGPWGFQRAFCSEASNLHEMQPTAAKCLLPSVSSQTPLRSETACSNAGIVKQTV